MKEPYEYGFQPTIHPAITRDEYDTMARYLRQKHRLRKIRQYQKEDFTL
jgi:hypothetical protein